MIECGGCGKRLYGGAWCNKDCHIADLEAQLRQRNTVDETARAVAEAISALDYSRATHWAPVTEAVSAYRKAVSA